MSNYLHGIRKVVGTMPIIVSGSRVIILSEDNEILLKHKLDIDLWVLPGGNMELGESFEETAVKKVRKAVGITCDELKFLTLFSGKRMYHKHKNGDEEYSVTAIYTCKSYHGVIDVNTSMGKEAKFFDVNSLPLKLGEHVETWLEMFINDLGGR